MAAARRRLALLALFVGLSAGWGYDSGAASLPASGGAFFAVRQHRLVVYTIANNATKRLRLVRYPVGARAVSESRSAIVEVGGTVGGIICAHTLASGPVQFCLSRSSTGCRHWLVAGYTTYVPLRAHLVARALDGVSPLNCGDPL